MLQKHMFLILQKLIFALEHRFERVRLAGNSWHGADAGVGTGYFGGYSVEGTVDRRRVSPLCE